MVFVTFFKFLYKSFNLTFGDSIFNRWLFTKWCCKQETFATINVVNVFLVKKCFRLKYPYNRNIIAVELIFN